MEPDVKTGYAGGVVGVVLKTPWGMVINAIRYAHGMHLVVLYFLAQLWPNQLVFNPQIQVK